MFKDLKDILISTCDDIISLYDKQNSILEEMDVISNQLYQLKDERKEKNTVIGRLIYKNRIKEIDEDLEGLNEEDDKLISRLREINQKLEDYEKQNISGYLGSIEKAENYKSKVLQAEKLEDLGIIFQDAVEFLEINNKEAVLDDSDKLKNTQQYGSKGIAFTHLTDYLPENGEILRMIDKGAKHTLSGEWGEITVNPSRETTHMAACSEVADVDFNSWEDKKIGIIIPLDGLPKDLNVTSYSPADFQVKDKLIIPDGGYIICPKDMADEAKQKNANINVIVYEGENVRGLVNRVLTYLGYDYMQVGPYDFVAHFGEIDNSFKVTYIRKIKEHFGIKDANLDSHRNSKEYKQEQDGTFFNLLEAFKVGIKNGTVTYNEKYKGAILSKISSYKSEELIEKLGITREGQTVMERVEEILDETANQHIQNEDDKLLSNLSDTYIKEQITNEVLGDALSKITEEVQDKALEAEGEKDDH